MEFVDSYVAKKEVLNERVLAAAARLVLVHLYALAASDCYTPNHNHGVMQDRTLMRVAHRLRHLPDAEALWEHAAERFQSAQLATSVSPDGVYAENSPNYHILFIGLLVQFIESHLDAGRAVVGTAQAQMPDEPAQPHLLVQHPARVRPLGEGGPDLRRVVVPEPDVDARGGQLVAREQEGPRLGELHPMPGHDP